MLTRIGVGCVTVACLWGALWSNAAVIAYERFNYDVPDGTPLRGSSSAGIDPLNGGFGWSSAWPNNVNDQYREAGMTHPGLSVSGGRLQTVEGPSTPVRSLTGTFGTDNTTVWLRFLIADASDTAGAGGFAGLSLLDSGVERLFIGKRNNATEWGIAGGESANSALAITSPALMLVQINFLPGNETVNLWTLTGAAPENENALGAADATISATDFQFNQVRIGSGTGNVYNFDEIVLASDYESLFIFPIPEPGTMMLLLLGLPLAALWRRNR